MATTKNLADVIRRKLASDADLAAAVEAEQFNANVATEIYRTRKENELTQKELADRVGTYQSVIARLEDADYDGHSLKMLERIAFALNKRLEVRFVDHYTTSYDITIEDFSTEEPSWWGTEDWSEKIDIEAPFVAGLQACSGVA